MKIQDCREFYASLTKSILLNCLSSSKKKDISKSAELSGLGIQVAGTTWPLPNNKFDNVV